MAKFSELAFLDATAQAELVRRKEVTPLELVEAAIERIERLNPALNAVVTPMYEQALEAARGKFPDGPFPGVPFLLKDLGATYAGVRFTAGSAYLRDFIPDHDSEIVVRLKRAGLIVVGKTNTPEFGGLATTEPHLFGPTRNPWDTTRTAGGSSGGSAAAVAAGMVPMAHASDAAGSIRIPASCCGVFGLKPTRARNPLGPDYGDLLSGTVAEHAVTRSVRDSAALLDATSGPELGDPYFAPPPARPFVQEVGADPGRLRIAFSATPVTGIPLHADCANAARDAARLCASLGHNVVEAAPPLDGEVLWDAVGTIFSSGIASIMDSLPAATGRPLAPDQFETYTWALYEKGRGRSAPAYLRAVTTLQRATRRIARFLLDYDVWLTPTLAEPPVPLGTFAAPADDPLRPFRRMRDFLPFTWIANFTGNPAMTVPLYWNASNLPVGTHFLGRFGDEATLFRLAARLEGAHPWAGRRPPVGA